MDCWLTLRGIKTLHVRMRQHNENGLAVAKYFEAHPKVDKVFFPGLPSHEQHELAKRQMSGSSSLVAFNLEGGAARAFRFLNSLRLVDISNNLGDAKSLITHPATTTHQRLTPEERVEQNIGPGLVRLSVGLEDVEDLKEDLFQALAVSGV